MPRTITHMLNMWNGDWSIQEAKRLRGLFDKAITIIVGTQQPPLDTMNTPPGHWGEVNRLQVEVRLIAEDLVCALLGPKASIVIDE